MDQHVHRAISWEVNPIELFFTRRCVRCGEILKRVTYAEAVNMKPQIPALINHMRKQTYG